ncbi:hypothetical protein LTR09_003562 [Extremus antarcticus]|uniref:Uncharacterized protein n=1 Tax=Extremus antarcticus TaxID=702011 RepID=A0AAJ0GDG7_9PEZI|nr:hypothetical protein LTR09_003562 [Extremus antarcticus]
MPPTSGNFVTKDISARKNATQRQATHINIRQAAAAAAAAAEAAATKAGKEAYTTVMESGSKTTVAAMQAELPEKQQELETKYQAAYAVPCWREV